jgi:hypothetical protein
MRSYFVAVRKIGDKTYCLAESRRRRGAGYIWVRTVGGLQPACLFESRPRAERAAADYSKSSELVPQILEVQEQTRFVVTTVTRDNVYWLEGVDRDGKLEYQWGAGDRAEQKACRFLTRAAAEKVNGLARSVRGGIGMVVETVDRIVVS